MVVLYIFLNIYSKLLVLIYDRTSIAGCKTKFFPSVTSHLFSWHLTLHNRDMWHQIVTRTLYVGCTPTDWLLRIKREIWPNSKYDIAKQLLSTTYLLIFYFNNTNSPPVAWDQPVWNVLLRMDVSSTAIFHVLECRTVSARLKSEKNSQTTKNWWFLNPINI